MLNFPRNPGAGLEYGIIGDAAGRLWLAFARRSAVGGDGGYGTDPIVIVDGMGTVIGSESDPILDPMGWDGTINITSIMHLPRTLPFIFADPISPESSSSQNSHSRKLLTY
jgi:hypothetical protein